MKDGTQRDFFSRLNVVLGKVKRVNTIVIAFTCLGCAFNNVIEEIATFDFLKKVCFLITALSLSIDQYFITFYSTKSLWKTLFYSDVFYVIILWLTIYCNDVMPTLVFILDWTMATREMFKELDKSNADYIKSISSAFLSNHLFNTYMVLVGVVCAVYIAFYSLVKLSLSTSMMIILDLLIIMLITFQCEEKVQEFWSFLNYKIEKFALKNRDTFGEAVLVALKKINKICVFAEYVFPKKELLQ